MANVIHYIYFMTAVKETKKKKNGTLFLGNSEKLNADRGQWRGDSGQWTVDSGQWTVDSGQWKVDSGRWTVDT
jgi:hypothetical protein